MGSLNKQINLQIQNTVEIHIHPNKLKIDLVTTLSENFSILKSNPLCKAEIKQENLEKPLKNLNVSSDVKIENDIVLLKEKKSFPSKYNDLIFRTEQIKYK